MIKSPSATRTIGPEKRSTAPYRPRSLSAVFCNMYCPKALSKCAIMACLALAIALCSSRPGSYWRYRTRLARPRRVSQLLSWSATRQQPIPLHKACPVPPVASQCGCWGGSNPKEGGHHLDLTAVEQSQQHSLWGILSVGLNVRIFLWLIEPKNELFVAATAWLSLTRAPIGCWGWLKSDKNRPLW